MTRQPKASKVSTEIPTKAGCSLTVEPTPATLQAMLPIISKAKPMVRQPRLRRTAPAAMAATCSAVDGYRWAAATTGSQNAAGYQLASELPVMAIGGFNGSDPAPTLDEFKSFVEEGLVRYYISSNGIGDGQMGGSDAASEIAEWVSANFEAQTIDGVTVYDLSAANASY